MRVRVCVCVCVWTTSNNALDTFISFSLAKKRQRLRRNAEYVKPTTQPPNHPLTHTHSDTHTLTHLHTRPLALEEMCLLHLYNMTFICVEYAPGSLSVSGHKQLATLGHMLKTGQVKVSAVK